MEHIVKYTTSNNKVISYQIINGTAYHEKTPHLIIRWLERARTEGARVRLTLGDTQSGRPWNHRPESGFVGRSTGKIKIPLLLKTNRSMGAGAIDDDCIIKLEYKTSKEKKYREVYVRGINN